MPASWRNQEGDTKPVKVDGRLPGLPNITRVRASRAHLPEGQKLEPYHSGRAHTNGDVAVYFPADRVLATGDVYTFGDGLPALIDYVGGGSAKEWPKTTGRVPGCRTVWFDSERRRSAAGVEPLGIRSGVYGRLAAGRP